MYEQIVLLLIFIYKSVKMIVINFTGLESVSIKENFYRKVVLQGHGFETILNEYSVTVVVL